MNHAMPNGLANEKSPYLLQHALNPVNWRPWGDAAFDEARRLDLPLFVSSGYAACHWCHVMAGECFEDQEVANALNGGFVCVKLDREERPDVDAFLMRACQMMTGSGGWPLSVFLTPDGRPFFAGTYFPKHRRGGMAGFMDILQAITDNWASNRDELERSALALVQAARQAQQARPGDMDAGLVHRCYQELVQTFDRQCGGFGRAPKFPTPHLIMFLLRYHVLAGDAEALNMATATLDAMASGGMYDQIGGGFCRYSTDRLWLVPHFEKMLYDNALLALAYGEAYRLTGAARYARVARSTLDYVLREMRGPEGGFFCAQDADTGGVEGAYYLFARDEVLDALGAEGEAVCQALGITKEGNFEGRSIPNRLHAAEELPPALAPALEKLCAYRARRMALGVDDKRLTAWNGMMIGALAASAIPLGRPDYLDAALDALQFIDRYLTAPDGDLYIRWREGEAAGQGTLDDYAYVCWALIQLYDGTLDAAYMDRARRMMEGLTAKFGGEPGFYMSDGRDGLAVRPKESADGALPSGNSVAALCLHRLSRFFADDAILGEQARAQLAYVAGAARRAPSGHAFGLMAGLLSLRPGRELVCATSNDQDARRFRDMLGARLLPDVTALAVDPAHLDRAPPWARACAPAAGKTTYFLCQNGACGLPMGDLQAVAQALDA